VEDRPTGARLPHAGPRSRFPRPCHTAVVDLRRQRLYLSRYVPHYGLDLLGSGFGFVHGFGRLGFFGFGSFCSCFVAWSNSVSTGRASAEVMALNLSYSNSALT
jgi:hypothetical protein